MTAQWSEEQCTWQAWGRHAAGDGLPDCRARHRRAALCGLATHRQEAGRVRVEVYVLGVIVDVVHWDHRRRRGHRGSRIRVVPRRMRGFPPVCEVPPAAGWSLFRPGILARPWGRVAGCMRQGDIPAMERRAGLTCRSGGAGAAAR